MRIQRLVWPQDRIDHIARHGVMPDEVDHVCFDDQPRVFRGKSHGENPVYYVLGQTKAGRYLLLCDHCVSRWEWIPRNRTRYDRSRETLVSQMEGPMSDDSKLPRTDSISELAAFWDSNDLTDFEDQLEEVADRIFARPVGRFEFALVLSAEPDADQADRLYSSIDDGAIVTVAGVPQVQFHRQAASMVEAIRSAIADVRAAAFEVVRVEITPDAVQQAS